VDAGGRKKRRRNHKHEQPGIPPCEGLWMLPTRRDTPPASTSMKPLTLEAQGAGEGGAQHQEKG